MPTRQIPDTDVQYELIVYDANATERREADGSLLSERIRARVADAVHPVTDVFFCSHGWKGDVPGALDQYDRWIGAVARLEGDRAAARVRRPNFTPLIIGLHWPSLPFGDERLRAPGRAGVLSPKDATDIMDAEVEACAARIADTDAARAAIRVILEAAQRGGDSTLMTPELRAAYATVFAESALGAADVAGAPGADQDGFDADAIVQEATHAHQSVQVAAGQAASGGPAPGVLGDLTLGSVTDALLSPLQQMSFWRMKARARVFGEGGAHELLVALQQAAPRDTRFHLMGHSFGCIVVSATIAGPPWRAPIVRPVHSLLLVQGALSLWSYAADVPYQTGAPGYFNRIVAQRLVGGAITATRSRYDTAVGTYYPRGARLKRQVLLDPSPFPKYGGTGSFGVQGTDPASVTDIPVQGPTFPYGMEPGKIYNVDADRVIKDGGPPSGAHSDIGHPEIAHLLWQGALAVP